jgi:hypothetical protein
MSFTTRQLGANRVNRMPGAPVSCEVKNYTLKEFDGVIKGTNENNRNAENLTCANGGILNINDTTLDPAIIDINDTIDDNTNKLVLVGTKGPGNAAKTLTVDGAGALCVIVSNGDAIGAPAFSGAVTNVGLTSLDKASENTMIKTTANTNGEVNDHKKFLVMGGRSDNGGTDDPATFKELKVDASGVLSVNITDGAFGGDISNDNLDKLNFNDEDDLKVVDSNISSASENTKRKNIAGEDVNVTDKKFLVIGGRSDNGDLNNGVIRVPTFKELKVDETGVLSVNINSGGGGAVTNDGLNNLNSALHDYGDNNAGTDKLLAIGVLGDDNKYTTLKLNDQGELKVNSALTSTELTQMAGATVEANNPYASPGYHFSVSGKHTGETNNISYEPIKVDDEGVVCVKTQGTNVVKTENDVLTSLNGVIFENENDPTPGKTTKYLRVSTDQVDGILMKGNDAAGGSTNQTISLVQGAILPAQVQNIITKPRLLTANIGRNISYSYSNDLENLNGGNGFTNPTDINGGGGGTLSPYLGKILITTDKFPTTEGSMINVYVRIICSDGSQTNDGGDVIPNPRPFTIYILGGIINTVDQFYNQRDSLVLDSIQIDDTYESTIKLDDTSVDTIYHTFKLNMPFVKGGGLGISSSKDLDNVYVGMSYPEY